MTEANLSVLLLILWSPLLRVSIVWSRRFAKFWYQNDTTTQHMYEDKPLEIQKKILDQVRPDSCCLGAIKDSSGTTKIIEKENVMLRNVLASAVMAFCLVNTSYAGLVGHNDIPLESEHTGEGDSIRKELKALQDTKEALNYYTYFGKRYNVESLKMEPPETINNLIVELSELAIQADYEGLASVVSTLCRKKNAESDCQYYGGAQPGIGFGLCSSTRSAADCGYYGGTDANAAFGICTHARSPSDCAYYGTHTPGIGFAICAQKLSPSDCGYYGTPQAGIGFGWCSLFRSASDCGYYGGPAASVGFGLCTSVHSASDCGYYGTQASGLNFGVCSLARSASDCGYYGSPNPSVGFAICSHKNSASDCSYYGGQQATVAFGTCSLTKSPASCPQQ